MRWIVHSFHTMNLYAFFIFAKPKHVSDFSFVLFRIIPAHRLSIGEPIALLAVITAGVGFSRIIWFSISCNGSNKDPGGV